MVTRTLHNNLWTKQRVIEEAQKYHSQVEWRKGGRGSLGVARENGWMEEATAHMFNKQKTKGYWTKERVLDEAKKYTYQTEWIKASGASHSAAKRNKWVKEACAHMQSPKVAMGHWTKGRLIEDAKKYSTRVDWKNANASAYATATSKGYLVECCAHMNQVRKPNGYWTKEKCLESSLQYPTVQSWAMGDGAAYDAAKRQSWYKDVISHMIKIVSHGEFTIYTFLLKHDVQFVHQKRFKDLKDKKILPCDFYLPDFNLIVEYQGRQHFATSKTSIFRKDAISLPRRDAIKREYAKVNGFHYLEIETQKTLEIEKILRNKIEEITCKPFISIGRQLSQEEKLLLKNLNVWTKEAVMNDAFKYKTLKEWSSNDNAACAVARKNGWLKEATAHMIRTQKPKGYWTKERVLESALNHQSSSAWLKSDRSAWATAQAKGWLEEATKHMPNRQKKRAEIG